LVGVDRHVVEIFLKVFNIGARGIDALIRIGG
jgi:hypothetical protein